MRITYIDLAGTKYPMCFSNSASDELADEFGSLDKMREAMASDNPFKAINKMLKILIKHGMKYCEILKMEHPEPLSFEPGDVLDMTDPDAIQAVFSAINKGAEREVEVVEKNATAKRGK